MPFSFNISHKNAETVIGRYKKRGKIMVVRTPGNPEKPGIHLEFENFTWNTWKTWNSQEKS